MYSDIIEIFSLDHTKLGNHKIQNFAALKPRFILFSEIVHVSREERFYLQILTHIFRPSSTNWLVLALDKLLSPILRINGRIYDSF